MSKDKPEVGDIWRNKKFGTVLHLIEAKNGYVRFIGRKTEIWGSRTMIEYFENSFVNDDERLLHFTEDYEYIGKAKANINQLFEVGNDE